MIEYQVAINGIEVKAQYTGQAVNAIFLPLLKELTNRQKQKGKRLLTMMAAPPGAGKSTLAGFLENYSTKYQDNRSVYIGYITYRWFDNV